MKIVFISNFMNHHQYGFCLELKNKCESFYFIACSSLPEEQQNLGYKRYNDDFILNYDPSNVDYLKKIVMDADSVIFGEKPEWVYNERIKLGKTDFIYTERLFKKGLCRAFVPSVRLNLKKKYIGKTANLPYLLCAGFYVKKDFALIGYPKDKCLKWGYFPPESQYGYNELREKKADDSILWVGRLIDWKHPEHAVLLARKLKKSGVAFNMTLVGDGPLTGRLRKLIGKYGLDDYVKLVGAVPADEVRDYFEKSRIAIATSDKKEGWGAVVNEAMASACAVVVNADMGSAEFLIDNNNNGLLYRRNRVNKLFRLVLKLLKDKALCENLGSNAFNTISSEWNYKNAASRLVEFIEKGEPYKDGIMSVAD